MQFDDRIRKLRQKWSLGQIADHMGVSPRTVEGYLAGRSPSPAASRLLRLLEDTGTLLSSGVSPPPQEN